MNKMVIRTLMAVVVLSAPALSFAQSSSTVTRAEVRAELAQLEKVGYSPSVNDIDYPENIQAAEAKVAMNDARQSDVSGMQSEGGMSLSGHSAAGKAMANACVGPVDFCTPFFGS
jgi:hypothetical protein